MKKMYPLAIRRFFGMAPFMLTMLIILTQSMAAFSQSRTIKGRVTDETNTPLPGVSVVLKGSTNGVQTKPDGSYSIAVQGNTAVLSFSFIGSETVEKTVEGNEIINVTLLPSTKGLKEVVVIGYGTANKRDVTGSITTLKSEDFNTGVNTTPAELLQGKVAGLNITKSGDPNATPSVILRGPSTIRSGAMEPFYVIDGVPGASIDLLAPSDIESIDVLKDASTTAIYGSRAANGVILVTTRKAKNGQSRLSYNSYASTQSVSKKIEMLTADELRAYLAENKQTLIKTLDDDGSSTNWQNLIQRRGYSQNHNLAYNGSSATAEYGASANYFKNEGVLKNTALERTILRGFINQRFFDNHLKLSLNVNNSRTNNDDIVQSAILPGMLFYLPTVSPFNPDGSYKENYNRTGSGTRNPLSLLDNNFIKIDNNKTLINGIAQVDILKGLKFTLSGSTQQDQNNYNRYYNSKSGLAVNFNGQANRTAYRKTSTVLETYFNYDREFGRHSLKLLGGYSYQQDRTNDGFGITTQNFSNDELTYNNLYLSNPLSLSQIAFDNNPISTLRLISFYGRVQYQFNNTYLFQASLRNDGSSAFGINNRWGYFPAVSAGWQIMNEKFMQDIPVISDLKLRAGYGESGNSQGFDAFSSLLIYGTQSGNSKFLYNGNIVNAIGPVRNDNPNLRWETTATTNIGLDWGLFKDRLSGSVDYYVKNTSDLIYDKYPVSTTQFFVPDFTANVGKVRNTGIEVVISAVPVVSGDFKWRTSLNFSHNSNEVVSLSDEIYKTEFFRTASVGGKGQSSLQTQIVKPGEAIGTFNLWRYAGKNGSGISTYRKPDGSIIAVQPLEADQMIAGSAQPKLIYGWNHSFFYKNFDLNFLVRGVYGNKVLNGTLAQLNNPSDAKLQNIPKFTLGESFNDINAYLVSDRYLESGSYLRMDNATLGYTIKPKIQSIKNIRLYLSGNNLFVITKYRGVDPEINMGGLTPGIDNNNFYPKTRTFIFGLSANF
jgi:TonB-linked SusC/RagA family outer membrane protein